MVCSWEKGPGQRAREPPAEPNPTTDTKKYEQNELIIFFATCDMIHLAAIGN